MSSTLRDLHSRQQLTLPAKKTLSSSSSVCVMMAGADRTGSILHTVAPAPRAPSTPFLLMAHRLLHANIPTSTGTDPQCSTRFLLEHHLFHVFFYWNTIYLTCFLLERHLFHVFSTRTPCFLLEHYLFHVFSSGTSSVSCVFFWNIICFTCFLLEHHLFHAFFYTDIHTV